MGQILLYVLVGIGPVIGYRIAFTRPERTRLQIVTFAAIGAGLPAAVGCAAAALFGTPFSELFPWAVAALAYGALVGVAGLLARIVGAWLSRHQS